MMFYVFFTFCVSRLWFSAICSSSIIKMIIITITKNKQTINHSTPPPPPPNHISYRHHHRHNRPHLASYIFYIVRNHTFNNLQSHCAHRLDSRITGPNGAGKGPEPHGETPSNRGDRGRPAQQGSGMYLGGASSTPFTRVVVIVFVVAAAAAIRCWLPFVCRRECTSQPYVRWCVISMRTMAKFRHGFRVFCLWFACIDIRSMTRYWRVVLLDQSLIRAWNTP